MDIAGSVSRDSTAFLIPVSGWWRKHQPPFRSLVLLVIGLAVVTTGLVGAARRVGEFQRLDIQTLATESGYLVVAVQPRSGAARAGLTWGDTIVAVDGTPAVELPELAATLFARRVSILSVAHGETVREVAYYPPAARIDIRYLLFAFAAMFTLVVAALVYLGRPTGHSGRFLALAQALFAAVVIPMPERMDAGWQLLLLVRDFGRLALPPLLVIFFATFPHRVVPRFVLWLAFVPSALLAAGRTALAAGLLPPVTGSILLPDFLDGATAVLAVAAVLAAAGLGFWTYLKTRQDPTRRRQAEWVALGAVAGFTPYLLLSVLPQLAGAEAEVLSWIALLPLALVPLGVASSLLEFRLWDLEDISRQVMATGAVVLLGGVLFALLNYGISEVGFRLGNWRNLVAVAGGVALVALMIPARRVLLEGLERVQYRERLSARRALTAFAEEAAGHRDPEELLNRLSQLLGEALGVDAVVTYMLRGAVLTPWPPDPALPDLTAEEVRQVFPSGAENRLAMRGFRHRFPLERDDRIVGVVYCGLRAGELPLGHGERRLVLALAAQASLALENTLLLADLRRQVQEHRRLEAYLDRVFESSAAALLICDARGRILRANTRASVLLGTPPQNLVGTPIGEHLECPGSWQGDLPSGAAGVQVALADHPERTVLVSTSNLEMETGDFDGRIVAVEDISEQLHLEQRLAEQERLAALGRLAAGLAHEVNTPVTGIASYAQLLHELTPPSDPRSPMVEKLEEQAFRVSRIVSNLLELARPSGSQWQMVDLAAVARDEVMQVRNEGDGSSVRVIPELADGAVLRGNRVQLELVVHNLLRNALQATPPGGTVNIRVGTLPVGVWLEVADTGPGIPSELGDRVFEPFVTTRQGRGGTGLGLAVTRDIVQAHGGTIQLFHNTPKGAVIRVEFPEWGGNHENSDH